MKKYEATFTNKYGVEFKFHATRDGFAYRRNPDKYEDGYQFWPTKDFTAMLRWLNGIGF